MKRIAILNRKIVASPPAMPPTARPATASTAHKKKGTKKRTTDSSNHSCSPCSSHTHCSTHGEEGGLSGSSKSEYAAQRSS